MAPGCTAGRTRAGYTVDDVFLGHFRPHYPNSTFPDSCQVSEHQEHPFIATVFLASDGHFLQDNTARIVKERFEEHDGESHMITLYKEKKSCCCAFFGTVYGVFFVVVDFGVWP